MRVITQLIPKISMGKDPYTQYLEGLVGIALLGMVVCGIWAVIVIVVLVIKEVMLMM